MEAPSLTVSPRVRPGCTTGDPVGPPLVSLTIPGDSDSIILAGSHPWPGSFRPFPQGPHPYHLSHICLMGPEVPWWPIL